MGGWGWGRGGGGGLGGWEEEGVDCCAGVGEGEVPGPVGCCWIYVSLLW